MLSPTFTDSSNFALDFSFTWHWMLVSGEWKKILLFLEGNGETWLSSLMFEIVDHFSPIKHHYNFNNWSHLSSWILMKLLVNHPYMCLDKTFSVHENPIISEKHSYLCKFMHKKTNKCKPQHDSLQIIIFMDYCTLHFWIYCQITFTALQTPLSRVTWINDLESLVEIHSHTSSLWKFYETSAFYIIGS